MPFHSQSRQDEAVLELFGDKPGFFLEIGASNGLFVSNTLALEERGWQGMCIEGDPNERENLRRNRRCITHGCWVNKSDFPPDHFTLRTLFGRQPMPAEIDYFSLDVEGLELAILKGFPFDTHTFKFATIENNLYLDEEWETGGGRHWEHKHRLYDFMVQHGYVRVLQDHTHGGVPYEDWYIRNDLYPNFDWVPFREKYR